jgi:hypothetical protein
MTEEIAIRLVEELAPLNNAFRKAVDDGIQGNEVLKILWDAGEVICSKNIEHVHNMAWKIYGRSDGKRHSYLTRDFIAYCWRVRRYFKERKDIDQNFPNLKSHKAFKEALPLLTNPAYRLSASEKQTVFALLNNEQLKATEIFDRLADLKKQKVPITNPRTQRLEELRETREAFDEVFAKIKDQKIELTKQQAEYLSSLWLALLTEGRTYPRKKPASLDKISLLWKKAIEISCGLLQNKNVEDRNRFRRVVKPEELLRASASLSKQFQKNQ